MGWSVLNRFAVRYSVLQYVVAWQCVTVCHRVFNSVIKRTVACCFSVLQCVLVCNSARWKKIEDAEDIVEEGVLSVFKTNSITAKRLGFKQTELYKQYHSENSTQRMVLTAPFTGMVYKIHNSNRSTNESSTFASRLQSTSGFQLQVFFKNKKTFSFKPQSMQLLLGTPKMKKCEC